MLVVAKRLDVAKELHKHIVLITILTIRRHQEKERVIK